LEPNKVLRSLLASDGILIVPGAFDCLSAMIIEHSQFKVVYATGAGLANATLGLPDLGFISLAEMALQVGRMSNVVNIPIIVDADTGYGGVLQVHRAVRELERAGAAGIQLEDQVSPKRCGHFDGQLLISIDDMVQKIRIAKNSQRYEDTLLIARTDARSVEGHAGAVKRANAYAQAGADVIFIEAPRSRDEVLELPGIVNAPLMINIVEGGKTPSVSLKELDEAGYKIALFANIALRASIKVIHEVMDLLSSGAAEEEISSRVAGWDDRQKILRLDDFLALAEHYST